jgi:hypothetical protein
MRLSTSEVLEPLTTLSIYGKAPLDVTQLVRTLTLQVPKEVSDAPWKRLSRPLRRDRKATP